MPRSAAGTMAARVGGRVVTEPETIVRDLMKVIEMLMPGARYIALQDYALLNDAQVNARRWLLEQEHAR